MSERETRIFNYGFGAGMSLGCLFGWWNGGDWKVTALVGVFFSGTAAWAYLSERRALAEGSEGR